MHTYQYVIQTILTMLLKFVVTFTMEDWRSSWQETQICSTYFVKISLLTCMHIWNLPWLPSPNNSLLVHNVCNRIWYLMSILSHQRILFKSGGLWKPTWIDMRNLIRKARWIEIFNFQMYENFAFRSLFKNLSVTRCLSRMTHSYCRVYVLWMCRNFWSLIFPSSKFVMKTTYILTVVRFSIFIIYNFPGSCIFILGIENNSVIIPFFLRRELLWIDFYNIFYSKF